MSPRKSAFPRAAIGRALPILGLFNLAVAHPLNQVLAASPEFFVAHRVAAIDVLLIALLMSVLLPAALAAVGFFVSRISERAGQVLHLVLVGLLICVLALQGAKHLGATRAVVALPFALVIGGVAALAYARLAAARTFAGLLAPAALVVPVLFVASPTVRPFVFPKAPQASARAVPARTPPIVVVVFDQLPLASLLDREGRIDRRLYPGFAALADQSTWFRNATAVADYTGWALPPIFTGLYPRHGTMPTSADFPNSLFTLLADSYETAVFEPITNICPDEVCPPDREPLFRRLPAILADETVIALHIIAPADVAARLPSVSQNWRNFAANNAWLRRWIHQRDSDRRDQPNRFISAIRRSNGRRPPLYVLHALLPHEPFMYARSGQVVEPAGFMANLGPAETWTGDEWPIVQTYQAHLVQLGYADALLGRIIGRLKDAGLFDEAIIVVTADHGARFVRGEPFRQLRRRHAADVMAVPLLIKQPGQHQGTVDDRNVETVDVTPTIAALLGVRLPWKHDGLDALDRSIAPRPDKLIVVYAGTERFRFPASTLEEVRASVDRKLSLFRDGDPRVPLAAPYPALIGRPVSELQVGDPWPHSFLVHEAYRFTKLDVTADVIPARVTGEVSGRLDLQESIPIAVSVNGKIQATTWTAGARGAWNALVPVEAFRAGRNEVEAFVPSSEPQGTVVLHPASAARRLPGLNLLSAAAAEMWGVRQSGLHGTEWNGTRSFRWTDGAARLEVPVAPGGGNLKALRVDVEMTGNRQPELRVMMNGCELYRGRVTGGWARTFSLSECPLKEPLSTIELSSESFRPRGEERTLGVALSSVALLDNESR